MPTNEDHSSNNNSNNNNNNYNSNSNNNSNSSNTNSNNDRTRRNPKKRRGHRNRRQTVTMRLGDIGVPTTPRRDAAAAEDGAVTQRGPAKRRRLAGRRKRAPKHANIARQRSVSPDRFVDVVRPTLMRLAECTATLRSADLAVFDARNELRTAASELMRWMRIMDHEIDPNEPDPDSDIDVEVYLAGTGAKKVYFRDPPDDGGTPGAAPVAGP